MQRKNALDIHTVHHTQCDTPKGGFYQLGPKRLIVHFFNIVKSKPILLDGLFQSKFSHLSWRDKINQDIVKASHFQACINETNRPEHS